MPAPSNVAEFLDVVRRSGIVPADALQAEVTKLKSDPAPPQTVDQTAVALIRDGVLTKFQAKQMKLGRYKRFEIAGKYRLLELLGIGGMGAVYLCEHQFMKRLVALKVLPVEKMEDPSALARFYREARAVAAMDHPNIVRAYDIDKYEQLHFLVMEYVDGTSIQEVVAKHGPISPLRAAHYAAQSAHGLAHAQELNLVHRDIKPGNLLLERTGVIKILDMGLARFFDQKNDNLTERFDNNCVLGTADYLAPEQAVSNVVDIRADIYALGGTMYFMLTGQSPFPDGTIASKLMAHQTKEPRPVTDFRKDMPPGLVAVLHKMMKKDPNQRFQTPDELAEALTPWTDEPVELPPVHEMPDLCPLVLTMTGHAMDKASKTAAAGGRQSLSATTSPPKSRLPLGPSSSGRMAPVTAQAGVATARASATLGPLTPSRMQGGIDSSADVVGDSSSEVVFNPLAKRPAPASAPTAIAPRRPTWLVAAAAAFVGLVLAGVVAGVVIAVTR
jgi:serine/threonine protein kinase